MSKARHLQNRRDRWERSGLPARSQDGRWRGAMSAVPARQVAHAAERPERELLKRKMRTRPCRRAAAARRRALLPSARSAASQGSLHPCGFPAPTS
jgi:hypothetical protein